MVYDKAQYKQRNKVERLFNTLKQFRRVATRYEQTHSDVPRLCHTRSHCYHATLRHFVNTA